MSNRETITTIQALRACAAIAVAIYHANYLTLVLSGHMQDAIPLSPLAAGVDVFFVISGFVMVHTARFAMPGAPTDFILRRMIRIVPLYWAATVVCALLAQDSDVAALVRSLLFIPYRNASGTLDPLDGVGWTLNFEMMFYALFAVGVAAPRRIAVPAISAALAALSASNYLFHPSHPALQFWTDPIALEFIFGMGLALLYGRVTLSPAVRCWMLIGSLGVIWMVPANTGLPSGARWLLWGIPAACIVAASVLGQRVQETGPLAKLALLLGDSSFSIYLLHPIAYQIVLSLWTPLQQWGAVRMAGAALLTAICVSVVVCRPFEIWSRNLLRGALVPYRRAVVVTDS